MRNLTKGASKETVMEYMDRKGQKDYDTEHEYSRENRVYKGGRWGTVNAGPASDKTEEEPYITNEYSRENRIYKGGRWGTVNAGHVTYDTDQSQPAVQ